MTYGQHWITELAGKPVDPPIHVRWSDVDPTAPVEPEPEPEPEPELPKRGPRLPFDDLRPISGKHVIGSGETLASVRGGYVTIQGNDVVVSDYYRPPELDPATGDGIRIDAEDHNIADITLSHVHIGHRLVAATGHHIDALQIFGNHGYRVGGTIRIEHSIFEAGASGTIFSKRSLLDGATVDLFNTEVRAVNHGVRLYSPEGGRCRFIARRSDLAKVSLVGDWIIDVDDESMPPGGIGRV